MKRTIFTLFVIVVSLTMTSCFDKNRELYKLTDKYVEKLHTTYQSYGLAGGPQEYTSDGQYRVIPIGRLVNVRIEKNASDKEYNDLLKDLKNHYKGNSHVNDVYRCGAGTLMIDCRN